MTEPREAPPPPRIEEMGVRPLLRDDAKRDGPLWLRLLLALGGAMAAGTLAVLVAASDRAPLLPSLVEERLSETGVSSPVTGVLLAFRGTDTLLEVVILVVAMTVAWSMDRGTRELGRDLEERRDDPVLRALCRLAVPLVGVMAVYLAWAGTHRSGGAFQAGALLAGAGVLLSAAGFLRPPTAASRPVRGIIALGLGLFIAAGLLGLFLEGAFLAHPAGWEYPLILGIEVVVTVTVAVVLVELFVDVPSVPEENPALARIDPTGDPLGRLLDAEGGLVEAPVDPDR
jgi:multisubunit Na+/H+ antiporter MnhB subunit